MLAKIILLVPCVALGMARTLRNPAHCDPTHKDEHCAPDPAFADLTSFDFSNASFDEARSLWSVESELYGNKGRIDPVNNGKGVALQIEKEGQESVLASNKYIFFGKVSVEIQAAPGQGVITAMALKSDNGNEIDWEIIGAYDRKAQSNYFHDGKLLFNTYNLTYDIGSSVSSEFHTYAVEWTDKSLTFSIDGQKRMTQNVGDIPIDRWPQTPMMVVLRTWAVRNDSDAGEIGWAGGKPDWDDGPFTAYFRKVEIEDYTGFCKEVAGPVEYSYDGRMSGWEDVMVHGCEKKLPPGDSEPHAPISTSVGEQPTGTHADVPGHPTAGETTGTGGPHAPSETGPSDGGDEDNANVLHKSWPALIAIVLVAVVVVV